MIKALHNLWLWKTSIFLSLFFAFILSQQANASHVFGTELGFKQIGTSKYLVKLSLVRDCNGIVYTPDSIGFKSQNTIFYQKLTQANKVYSKDITGIDPKCSNQSRCTGTYTYGFEKIVFVDTVDLSAYSDCEWTIIWSQCCRNGNITTGAANTNHYNYAWLNKCYNNSAPEFLNNVAPLVCRYQDQILKYTVTDTNDIGDSFSYRLVPALEDSAISVPYNGVFSGTRPLTFFGFPNTNLQIPAGLYLNQTNGLLYFRPMIVNQVAIIVIEVQEWKKVGNTRVLVSVIRRDHDIVVINCPNNIVPSIDSIRHEYEICIKDTLQFEIQTRDTDNGDSTKITWNGGLPFGSFSSTNGLEKHAKGVFTWIPAKVEVSDFPYTFFIEVKDDACPISGVYSDVFFIYVRDSIDGANVDAGPDIIDSTGKDTLLLTGSLQDYSGQPLLWTSSGDGVFSQEDSLWTYYIPGYQDKHTCSYELYFQVLDSTPCLGSSKLKDTLLVSQYLEPLDAGPDLYLFYGDSTSLNPLVDTSRARHYAWRSFGDGMFGDSSVPFTYYNPGINDWVNCSVQIELSVYGCSDDKDTIDIYRKYEPLNAGADINGLNADSVQLNAQLSQNYNQKAFWRSTGTGSFSNSLDKNSWYIPSKQDWSNCGVQLIWQELPANNCSANADTIQLNLLFNGLNAGPDQSIDLFDSAYLNASPKIGLPSWGYWTSLGDGVFNDSNDISATYAPGTQDIQNCGTSLIWNYPYPNCSLEKDTLQISFNPSAAQAGVDQSIEFGDDLILSAVPAYNGLIGGWWTTNGDGIFSDSTQSSARYYPGPEDWYACKSTLYWNTPSGYCTSQIDSMQWTRIPRNADAGPDITNYGPVYSGFTAKSFAPSAMKGWWKSLNNGIISDSSQLSISFIADSAAHYACEGKLVWITDSASCIQWTDTVKWSRKQSLAIAGPDIQGNASNTLPVYGYYQGGDPIWETSGTGFFDSPRRANPFYTPSKEDIRNCKVTLYLRNDIPASCFKVLDSLQIFWAEKPIQINAVLFDSCYMDSLFIQLDTGSGGQISLVSDGTESLRSTANPMQWYYKVSTTDFQKGIITFKAKRVGNCSSDSTTYTVDLRAAEKNRRDAGFYGPIKLYPNPSTDFITIEGYCPVVVYEATLYDMRGREIQSWKVNELPFKMNIESIAQENYILRLRLHAGRIVWIPVRKMME